MATKGRGRSGGRRPGKSQSRKSSGGKGGSAPRDKSGSAGRAGAKPPADYPWGARPYRPEMTQKAAREAIRDQIGQRIPLREYRASITPLTPDERELLLDQAQRMLEFLYVHLPLKRALYASDPIQKLRLLRLSHAELDERAFQSAMIDVFVGLRDLHTNYVLPAAYGNDVWQVYHGPVVLVTDASATARPTSSPPDSRITASA